MATTFNATSAISDRSFVFGLVGAIVIVFLFMVAANSHQQTIQTGTILARDNGGDAPPTGYENNEPGAQAFLRSLYGREKK